MSLLNVFNIAGSAMIAQSQKINIIASNIANSESMVYKNGKFHPYIAKRVIFQVDPQKNSSIGGVKVSKVINIENPYKLVYDPNHPLSDKQGYIKTSNVNLVEETINNIEASRSYQANIEVLKTIKTMIIKTLTIGE
ncbi:flagellar basal body rod protein FlgC [Buchnera aphidicola]|uniref:flagellar basal body rod protein FlgC n=1 Tax=Buchnera aphidicola TaxID=9 RepID=UPI003BEF0F7C